MRDFNHNQKWVAHQKHVESQVCTAMSNISGTLRCDCPTYRTRCGQQRNRTPDFRPNRVAAGASSTLVYCPWRVE